MLSNPQNSRLSKFTEIIYLHIDFKNSLSDRLITSSLADTRSHRTARMMRLAGCSLNRRWIFTFAALLVNHFPGKIKRILDGFEMVRGVIVDCADLVSRFAPHMNSLKNGGIVSQRIHSGDVEE